jgi:nucleoside-diphosphate-sugar epimerase
MHNIIITGASGFVGQHLSLFFESQGVAVQRLSMRENDWANQLDTETKALIHLAGKAHDTQNTAAEKDYFDINTGLTQQLFDLYLKSSITDFIYFSSVKAAADVVEEVLFEDITCTPQTPYGKSKLQAEDYLLQQKLPAGKRLFILRPCMIHGPGNKGNLNLLYQVVSKNIPYPLGKFKNERSFLSIDNLNFIVQSILSNKTIPSGIYNLADDDFVSTNELIQIIAHSQNKKSKIWNIPKAGIHFLARLGDFLHLPLNSERLKKLTENYRVSNLKIKTALGIKKLPLSAQEGLTKTIKSFSKIK